MKFRAFALMLIVLALLPAALPAAAQEDVCFQKGGRWNADDGTCVISTDVEIELAYPIEYADVPVIADAVDRYFQQQRVAFLEPMLYPSFFSPVGPLTLMIDYETFQFSESVLSLKFTTYTFSGGAHGMTTFKTLTFDLDAGAELTLGDLFQPGVDPYAAVAPIAQARLTEQLSEMTDADWIASGTAPAAENYQNWVLTPDSLDFTFEQYQVAAYAAGPQTVSIPLAELQDVLAAPYAPGS